MALVQLVLYCLVMFVSTFSIGSLPILLSSSISERNNRRLSLFGIGLLLGTAFTVIIPEGISTLLSAPASSHDHETPQNDEHHSSIGIALLTGFAFMLLIDQASTPDPATPSEPHPPSLSTAEINPEDISSNYTVSSSPSKPLHSPPSCPHSPPQPPQKSLLAPTLGLLTHSLADGISLGASSTLASHSLDFVIFLAILVHKAPVACALVTVLIGDGVPKQVVRRVLLGFSAAAPIGALITYAVVSLFLGEQEQEREYYWIGIALLFSGGTFLFVAIHAMVHCMTHSATVSTTIHGSPSMGKWVTSALLVGGMMAPTALLAGFGHHSH